VAEKVWREFGKGRAMIVDFARIPLLFLWLDSLGPGWFFTLVIYDIRNALAATVTRETRIPSAALCSLQSCQHFPSPNRATEKQHNHQLAIVVGLTPHHGGTGKPTMSPTSPTTAPTSASPRILPPDTRTLSATDTISSPFVTPVTAPMSSTCRGVVRAPS
jgi:hypothetical protein